MAPLTDQVARIEICAGVGVEEVSSELVVLAVVHELGVESRTLTGDTLSLFHLPVERGANLAQIGTLKVVLFQLFFVFDDMILALLGDLLEEVGEGLLFFSSAVSIPAAKRHLVSRDLVGFRTPFLGHSEGEETTGADDQIALSSVSQLGLDVDPLERHGRIRNGVRLGLREDDVVNVVVKWRNHSVGSHFLNNEFFYKPDHFQFLFF